MGIRILNYLDDWLILAQSQMVLISHKTLLLSHLDCLVIRVNFAKSILSPSQRVSFPGTVIDSVQMTATVSAERATTIQRHAASFKEGTARPLKAFQRMLGLMAAASPGLRRSLVWEGVRPAHQLPRNASSEPGRSILQDKPWSRHVVKEQRLRRMDAPSARGSENLRSLWQSSSRPFRLWRQLSLPNLFHKEHGCPGPRVAQWPIPLRWNLLSQANSPIWHPRPELWALHACPLNGSLSASQSVSETRYQKLEPRLLDASMLWNGLFSRLGVKTAT